MGNFFSKEIICNECQRQNMKPDFFERKIVRKRKHNLRLLFDDVPVVEKIDKYGKVLPNNPIINMIDMNIIKCTCSNNHVINLRK